MTPADNVEAAAPADTTEGPPDRTTWTSCCVRLDKRAVVYFTQLAVGATIISFCVSMLVLHQDCVTFSRWGPLLTFIVGVYLPQPALNRGP